MKYSIETFAPLDVLYVRGIGPYGLTAPQAWGTLWDWVSENGLAEKTRRGVGFGWDSPALVDADDLRYDACLAFTSPQPPDAGRGILAGSVPGGLYAIHRSVGPYYYMAARFARLQHVLSEDDGYEIDFTRPFQEIYINWPKQVAPDELLTDLCIPLKG